MKKVFLFLSAFIVLTAVTAKAQDTKAKTILDGVAQLTKSYSSIEIEFTYTMENKKSSIKESKSGTALMKGDKYWLSFSGQVIISDGKTQWTHIKDNNEVHINTLEPDDEQHMNPATLLTSYDKDFTPKFIKEETQGGKTVQILDLTPITPRSYFKIRLTIDKAKKQIISSVVHDKNGASTYTYLISKFTPNKAVPDSKFTFNAKDFPGIEVIDLR
jgi:outer membrane lipoprotein-sorting protein